jgi:hydrogenase maturation protease
MEHTLGVIGIGNPLRHDDAIGIVLLNHLRGRAGAPSSVSFLDGGTGGMNLLYLIERYWAVMLLDAVQFGGAPGEWRFFSYDEAVSTKEAGGLSTHTDDAFSIVRLAHELGRRPVHLFIFGVQPAEVSYGHGLSKILEENLPQLQGQVSKKLDWMLDALLFPRASHGGVD